MLSKLKIILTSLLIVLLLSFTNKKEIASCFISFKTASGLTATPPDKLPEGSEKFWSVKTEKGEVNVSRLEGYRILYNNEKKAPFVNLKVERSEEKEYENDKKNLIDYLKYLNSHATGMESKEILQIEKNGYTIYGLSRGSIEKGSTLGTFILFPGDGIIVYFYFNNLTPEFRNFDSVEDYKKQRDEFLNAYTAYLKTCKMK